MPRRRRPGRPKGTTRDADTRSDRIASAIRARIVDGTIHPGGRLATWDELGRQYGVARPTVKRAIEQLKRDGFIYADSTRGMFVAARPPHAHRYAVVFAYGPQSDGWNRFWATLSSQAQLMSAAGEREIELYFDASEEPHNASLRRLSYDLAHDRLAGIVFVDMYESGSALRRALGHALDGVALASTTTSEPGAAIARVRFDFDAFVERSVAYLQGHGCTRAALLTTAAGCLPSFLRRARAAGLVMEEQWQLAVDVHSPWTATNLVRVLMDAPARMRPDGLVIADDNLVESALAGLAASGVRIPADLEVVAHCNWQSPPECPPCVRRLGFDVREVLAGCFDAIDATRRGARPPAAVMVRPRFEDELEPVARKRMSP